MMIPYRRRRVVRRASGDEPAGGLAHGFGGWMVAQEYTVRLEAFEGPLDLLLYLIRRAEVDVSEISVARIADQYLSYLEQIERIDVEVAGEFLVTAATIVEIKSRLVQAGEDGEVSAAAAVPLRAGEEESPATVLVRQLLEYKAYRDAADTLEGRREEWLRRYPMAGAAADREALVEAARGDEVDLEDIDLMDLVEAFQRIIETVQFDRLGDHEVVFDDTPIELHAADLIDRLERGGAWDRDGRSMTLRELLEGRKRGEMIGLFLALLEVTRQRRVRLIAGEGADGVDIAIALRDEEGEGEEASPEAAAGGEASWDGDHILDEDDVEDDDGEIVDGA